MQKIQFHKNRNRWAMKSRQFTSSSTHQQCVHDDQLSLCVDHGHGVPSNDAYRDERGFSWVAPNLHAILSRPWMRSAVNIYRRWCPSVCSRTNLGSCIDVGWRWSWRFSRPGKRKVVNKLLELWWILFSLLLRYIHQRVCWGQHQPSWGQRSSNGVQHPWWLSWRWEPCVYHRCWCSWYAEYAGISRVKRVTSWCSKRLRWDVSFCFPFIFFNSHQFAS